MKNRTIFWIPRTLTIIFILFISMFALDVFGNGLGFFQVVFALIMHLIPSIVLILILVIFWNKDKVLGWMWIIFGVWYLWVIIPTIIRDFQFYYLSWIIIFSGLAFFIAWLFFYGARNLGKG